MKVSPAWLALSVPLFALSLWLLGRTIRGLVRMTRGSVVASVPFRDEQPLKLDEAGDYGLYVEGRRFSTDFARTEFELADSAGASIPLRQVVFRTNVSGMSRVRLQVRQFSVPAAGRYTLRIRGSKETADPDNRVVIARPVRGAMVGYILALVGLGVTIIGSLVGSILIAVWSRTTTGP